MHLLHAHRIRTLHADKKQTHQPSIEITLYKILLYGFFSSVLKLKQIPNSHSERESRLHIKYFFSFKCFLYFFFTLRRTSPRRCCSTKCRAKIRTQDLYNLGVPPPFTYSWIQINEFLNRNSWLFTFILSLKKFV